VDKKRLNLLINNPKLLSKEDYNELSLVKTEFPYMQGILPLLVLSAKKYNIENYKKTLQSAAICTIDRVHLKELLILFDDKVTVQVETTNNPSSTEKQDNSPLPIVIHAIKPAKHLPETFFKEFYEDMDKLKLSKEAYNETLQRIEEISNESILKNKTATQKAKKKSSTVKVSVSKTTEAAKTKKKTSTTSKKDSSKKKIIKKRTKSEPIYHTIIEEIKLKEIKAISDAHLMEQINLITSFIEKEPSINKKMLDGSVDAKRVLEDLSESSTHLSDDVISETLAKLMIKQGRKEKAIDIYKKLIWKFPQKKAYFAEHIKNLKIEE
jgi:tetratricopeptide (TPR) repeat protein